MTVHDAALMTPRAATATAPAAPPRTVWLAAALIVAAVFAAYSNSLHGPFTYDDKPAIALNPSIRSLWPLGPVLNPPTSTITTAGRPVLNLSFALNFAAGGKNVTGYHLTNIAIHALAALALFGLVRRACLLPTLKEKFGDASLPLALGTALWWALQPLQTEAVTYTVQRAESLMGLFYLLTLYAFVRSLDEAQPRRWQVVTVVACVLGMATKENMVSVPIMALLIDRVFGAGDLRAAWQKRKGLYLTLASTWLIVLLLLKLGGGNRGGSVGFDVGVSWWNYELTQFKAIARYLALSAWPYPLVFDYGTFLLEHLASVWAEALLAAAIVGVTLHGLWRGTAIGVFGAWFCAILAPTTLIPGTTQMIVEHRMYLALVPLVVAAAAFLVRMIGARHAMIAISALGLALGVVTFQRNTVYRDLITLWSDTAVKRPINATAHASLGSAYADAARPDDAIEQFKITLKLMPDLPATLADYGSVLTEHGRVTEALPLLERAVQLAPKNAAANLNLGVALDVLGRREEALPYFAKAVELSPVLEAAHNDYGAALCRAGRKDEGIRELQEALRINPNSPEALFNLGGALPRERFDEAAAYFAAGFRVRPNDMTARTRWAGVLYAAGKTDEALAQHDLVVRTQPDYAEGRYNYGTLLAVLEHYPEAQHELEAAIRVQPTYAEAHNNLGNVLLTLHRPADAVPEYEAALRLKPQNPSAHDNLGLALAQLGRLEEALPHFEAAVRQAPNFAQANEHLAAARAQLGR